MSLASFLEKNNVLYAVTLNSDDTNWQEYGNKENVKYQGIISRYFPGPQIASQLDDFLENGFQPQVVTQGEVACMLFKPNPEVIFGILIHHEGFAIDRVRKSRELNECIKDIFSKRSE